MCCCTAIRRAAQLNTGRRQGRLQLVSLANCIGCLAGLEKIIFFFLAPSASSRLQELVQHVSPCVLLSGALPNERHVPIVLGCSSVIPIANWGRTHLPAPAWVVGSVSTCIFRAISVRNGTAWKWECAQGALTACNRSPRHPGMEVLAPPLNNAGNWKQ